MTDSYDVALANLRHAYHQLVAGVVKDQKQFADGLIAPAIRAMEDTTPISGGTDPPCNEQQRSGTAPS